MQLCRYISEQLTESVTRGTHHNHSLAAAYNAPRLPHTYTHTNTRLRAQTHYYSLRGPRMKTNATQKTRSYYSEPNAIALNRAMCVRTPVPSPHRCSDQQHTLLARPHLPPIPNDARAYPPVHRSAWPGRVIVHILTHTHTHVTVNQIVPSPSHSHTFGRLFVCVSEHQTASGTKRQNCTHSLGSGSDTLEPRIARRARSILLCV